MRGKSCAAERRHAGFALLHSRRLGVTTGKHVTVVQSIAILAGIAADEQSTYQQAPQQTHPGTVDVEAAASRAPANKQERPHCRCLYSTIRACFELPAEKPHPSL